MKGGVYRMLTYQGEERPAVDVARFLKESDQIKNLKNDVIWELFGKKQIT